MYSSKERFALMEFDKLEISYYLVRFVETESVPRNTKIIDNRWAKVNKNGIPDKRFNDIK